MADGPLRDVRILDLTHVWAGPLATRILADLGAVVVKIESPMGRGPREYRGGLPIGGWLGALSGGARGDAARKEGALSGGARGDAPRKEGALSGGARGDAPRKEGALSGGARGDAPRKERAPPDEPWNVNAVFVKLQRNKQSVAVDLKTSAGRATFLELVAVADVVMENFSARAMPALGLDYETLAEANPNIVYIAMPGYGKSGPYRDRVAFGPTVEPMSGLTTVMGYGPDEPRNTAMALMDPITAVNAAAAVVDALRRRQRTGKGAYVEMSLHEGGVAFCGPWLIETQLVSSSHGYGDCAPAQSRGDRKAVASPMGNRHPEMAPHGVYPCAGDDDWIAIACRDEDDWQALCGIVAGLSAEAGLAQRFAAQDEIDAAIAAWTAERSKTAAAELLQNAGVPAGAVNITPDMTADAQVQARGFFVPLETGPTPMPGNPVKMAGIGSDDWTPCPRLGADNGAVLQEWLGYDEERIAALERAGVLVDKPPK